MASTSQMRVWWRSYLRAPGKLVNVTFPTGPGKWIALPVAAPSVKIWVAVSQIMATEGYYFLEMAGGTYNPRIGQVPASLHAYGLALDLNPSKNPFQNPVVTDMPPTMIARIEGIRANGKQAVMWGGRFPASNPPDPMHYQINVAPIDCKNVTWDKGVDPDMAWSKPGDPVDDLADARKVNEYQGWSYWRQADFDYDENDPRFLDERNKIITARMIDWMMRNAKT